MTDLPLPFYSRILLRIASSINGEATLPLRVPAPTVSFLHRLGYQCDDATKPLGRFLFLITPARLVNEIIRMTLPKAHKELRTELERLQREKEDAVANQEWQRAANLLYQTDSLKDQLRQLGRDNPIDVQPEHILQAIANLGFTENIDLNG